MSWVLSVVSPGSGTPTGTVNVSDGHGNTCSATAPANTCTITASTVAGPLTLTVTYLGDSDFYGSTGSGTHTISFNFLGLFDPYAPPPRGYKVKSAVPLIWQYADVNGTVVNSSNANPAVQIYVAGACGGADTGDILDIQASGNSGYQYDPTTNTWQFNWKTTGMSAGCYNIYIKSTLTGQINGPFPIQLVR
ncbi:MAG TPA: PxKF domain-containing protein [Terriglobia bacterium]|nr:PxKF domain-containing protein [Terriglobia bacterium]